MGLSSSKMECSINAERIQAMKHYKRVQFLYNFILYSLTSLITFFFFSYSFWFPSIKHLLFSLPNNINPMIFNAKSLFIIANLIIFVLVGESKLQRSSYSSSASDIYDEYIARSQSCLKINSHVLAKEKEEDGFMQSMKVENKKHGNISNVYDEKNKKEMDDKMCKSVHHKEKKKEVRVCKTEVWGESMIDKKKKTKGEKEGQLIYIPREELNKRVEAFIARVNKQRLLEAYKVVDHSRG